MSKMETYETRYRPNVRSYYTLFKRIHDKCEFLFLGKRSRYKKTLGSFHRVGHR